MTFPRAQLAAWLGRKPAPIAAALVLVSGLRSDIAAFRTSLAETRVAIAALREAWSRTPPRSRSRRSAPARAVGTCRRMSGRTKEVELT